MKKCAFLILGVFLLSSCASLKSPSHEGIRDEGKESKPVTAKKSEKGTPDSAKASGIVVDAKDIQTLEKMTKAVESYVLKNDKRAFASLCKDKRFDCFVDDVFYPKSKKKVSRTVPPYASGSKMGLQGEKRVHVKYDFYP